MYRFEVVCLLASIEDLLPTNLASIVILVPHRVWANIECQANCLSSVLHVATTLDDVFRGDLKGRRAIFLFKASCEVTLMIVLPLKQAGDLIDKLRRLNTLICLVHGTLIRSLERWVVLIVKKTATCVACLIGTFAAHDVEDKGVTWDFLVHLNFDDVSSHYLLPVRDDKATRLF